MFLCLILLLLLVYIQRGGVTSAGNPAIFPLSLDLGLHCALLPPLPEARPELVLRTVPESHQSQQFLTAPCSSPGPGPCLLWIINVSSEMLWDSYLQLRLSHNHMIVIPYDL